ncbi:MAG: D-Ala-D-Ala carboxypeptidase family metallohydrolase [Gallionellaceae bacterium]|jgi:hypothetical protein
MKLSAHFSLSEFIASDTAVRMGIDNTPDDGEITELFKLAEVMELVRAELNSVVPETRINVTSGYRCEKLERVLTKKDYSAWCVRRKVKQTPETWDVYFKRKAHPKGHGCDFGAPVFGDPLSIVRLIANRPHIMQRIDQIIVEGVTKDSYGWVHIGISDEPRHMVMTAEFKDGTPTYTQGVA